MRDGDADRMQKKLIRGNNRQVLCVKILSRYLIMETKMKMNRTKTQEKQGFTKGVANESDLGYHMLTVSKNIKSPRERIVWQPLQDGNVEKANEILEQSMCFDSCESALTIEHVIHPIDGVIELDHLDNVR